MRLHYVWIMFQKIYQLIIWKRLVSGLCGYIYDFSVNHDSADVDDILDFEFS